MFSYFEKGINDIKNSKFIGLPELVQIIRKNPNAIKIDSIRNLRINSDDYYKILKSQLPYITPNCMVNIRSLNETNFEQNFIQFSGYLYFDIDKWDSEEYKKYFIKRYGHLASMVCLSSSGGGISVLFKVKNTITRDNFDDIWSGIRNTILSDEPIDMKCKDIGRALFISHDPSVFYNYENEIEVELREPDNKIAEKRGKQSKSRDIFNNTLTSPYSIPSIDKVLEKLVTRTPVDVLNPVVDFKPVEYLKVFIPQLIKDGSKHTIYTSMIHALVHLNPSIEREYIFSFMFYINNHFAKPKMEKREFIRLFNLVYAGIAYTGQSDHL